MQSLQESLESNQFTITAEVCPPKGADVKDFISKALALKERVNAINVTDNQRAIMRLGSLGASIILLNHNIDPIYQLTCRDRNRIALQSDLLSAAAFGIKNVLLLTGDHVSAGDHIDAKPVFDLDSVQLIDIASRLNHGFSAIDKPIKGKTSFFIGGVVNPGANPLEPEIITFEKKVQSGARFFQTQAIYDIETLRRFLNFVNKFDVYILAGILVLKSAKMARFLNDNVAGVNVPQDLIKQLEDSKDPLEKGIEIAAEQIKSLKNICHGVHIMTVGQEEIINNILDKID
ncbi:MAG TPA: methylenetetrahydrofolate reductase [Nitrospinota bacterium]|nr:methylenetetrahydrofolate reductase [Nitrospinota bacterium]